MFFTAWRKERKRQKKAKKAWELAKLNIGGQPIDMVQGVPSAGKSPRNIARMKKCEEVIAKLKAKGKHKSDPDLYNSWVKEYNRRMARFQQGD